MKKLGFIFLASLVISNTYGASEERDLSDYYYDISCKEINRIVSELEESLRSMGESSQMKDEIFSSTLANLELNLECDEAHISNGTLFGSDRVTKAEVSSNIKLCQNAITWRGMVPVAMKRIGPIIELDDSIAVNTESASYARHILSVLSDKGIYTQYNRGPNMAYATNRFYIKKVALPACN